MMFADFWALYPRRVARRAAEKAFDRLTDEEKRAAVQALPAHVRHWRGKSVEYIPHAATWLNQARWEDELPAAQGKYGGVIEQLTGSLNVIDISARRVG